VLLKRGQRSKNEEQLCLDKIDSGAVKGKERMMN
jgi:hypothetical protein